MAHHHQRRFLGYFDMLRVRSLLILLIIAVEAMADRGVRSPGGSGWQGNGGFGQRSVARSSNGWSNFGSGTGQEEYGARSNGWSGKYEHGSSRSGSFPSGTGWGARGGSQGTTFDANTYKSNAGWSANSGGWPRSGSSSNSWDDPTSARGWQSSVW